MKQDRDSERSMFTHLSESICHVASELCKLREQQQIQFEWSKSHHGLATKHDLEQMEKRLTDAIANNATITPSIETAAMKVQSALDRLDAEIPDKKES